MIRYTVCAAGRTYTVCMDAADQVAQNRKFLWVLVAAIVPFAALTTLLLTSLFGPSDVGVQCTRQPGSEARCEVLQSRLLGLAANSAFPIAESEITAARAVCAQRGVGGRGGPSCSVNLLLKSGPYRSYPVLSYPSTGEAESSARKLNDYFADSTRSSIVLKDEIGSTVAIVAGVPLLAVALALALRAYKAGQRSRSGAGFNS